MTRRITAMIVLLTLPIPGCFSLGDDCDECDCGGGGSTTVQTGTGTVAVGQPCSETDECVPGSICFNEYCVGQGTLRVSLGFNVDSDYDLHVLTPDGSEIFFGNRLAGGGELDVDQCISSCGTTAHAENVVFDGTAARGTYEVWVDNFDARSGGPFTIEVAGGVTRSFSGSLPAAYGESEHYTFTY
ncbi:MAG: hypothetical protein JW751_06235 [Polyangiaceae bacterium]|nr:hypothetical protein [Polyangiaceae bacterium]